MDTLPDINEALQKQLRYWQEILQLRDWNVDLRAVRRYELGNIDSLAECNYSLPRKDAIIKVVVPEDLDSYKDRFIGDEERDYDITLVHELLHLHFSGFDDSTTDDDAPREILREQAINAISRALVRLYRESPLKPDDNTKPVGNYF